ncbi:MULTISPECIES: HdeD family acid-resistance protein [unclassified Gordonia (in: high G+C Gram-positive bacteria)]
MTFSAYTKQFPDEAISTIRSALIFTSILGIVLGIVALVWTNATVVVLGFLFGVALIVMGLFRIYLAFSASFLGAGWRVLSGVLGLLVLAMGIIAVFSPEDAVWLLALFIGIGWIFQGISDLAAAFSKTAHAPTWYLILSGVISLLAGIVLAFIAPFIGLQVLVWVAGIMLIVVSIATLFTLPKKVSAPPAV